jgi:hypothetical protein
MGGSKICFMESTGHVFNRFQETGNMHVKNRRFLLKYKIRLELRHLKEGCCWRETVINK